MASSEIAIGGTELQESPVEVVFKKIGGVITLSVGDYLFQNVASVAVGETVITLNDGTKIALSSKRAFREAFVSRTTRRQADNMIAADRWAGASKK